MRQLRLAHGWRLLHGARVSEEVLREFLRPAVRAVPRAMAARWGACRISLPPRLDPAISSRWTETSGLLDVVLATEGVDGHDLAMELLVCLGEALWGAAGAPESEAYLKLLGAEIDAAVPGEIDEEALHEKRLLLSSRASARSRRRLERYARASFAATAAEYVHCLWHEVTVRTGPEHLPATWLRRRLETLARWFPPDRGHRLFPRSQKLQ